MVSDVSSKSPVVNTVLEEVSQWHRCMREAVDEDGLEESLSVMDGPASGGNATKTEFVENQSKLF